MRELLSPSSDPRVLNSRLELAASLEAAGKMNIAMTSYFLLQDLEAVIKLLVRRGLASCSYQIVFAIKA